VSALRFLCFVLAYALSIHKLEGSEYPVAVVLILPQHYVMLQPNLSCTAITRAMEVVVFAGSKRAIAMTIGNNKLQSRYTGLANELGAS
jgi:exodeoxyribonuclease V alpha subunit